MYSMKNNHNNSKNISISVIGLGKLGSPLAAVLSYSGFKVIGYDINDEVVDKVKNGIAPVEEPQLQDFMNLSGERLTATSSLEQAISNTDVTFIIVPTPSDQDNLFSNDYLIQALTSIGKVLANKTSYHLVAVNSTVVPGSMDTVLREALENSSGKSLDDGSLGLCYNPEFIALGSVIKNMQYPDMTLIGESSFKAGDLLESIYAHVCLSTPEVHRMNFVNAELTKISINTYVTTKISYANMLAEMCDHLPESDVDTVTDAVGADSRIGKKYLKGAIGYAGPCFPRDNKAFYALGDKIGVSCDIAKATDTINDRQVDRLVSQVLNHASAGDNVTVLGLSYKVDTPEIVESQGISLCERLSDLKFVVTAHDPMANDNARSELSEHIDIASSLKEAISKSNVIVITTPWPDYEDLYAYLSHDAHLIDPWGIVTIVNHDVSFTYSKMRCEQ